ncbi:MAG TPA: SRPBCC domain-containing protein, partial [Actinomycetota bacterium]
GALAGDDWEREYAAMGEGDPMYFRKLIEYLTYFRGRTAVSIEAFGPNLGEGDHSWHVFRGPLGIVDDPEMDQPTTLRPVGMDPIEGVVDTLSKSFLGVRTDDAMYRFIVGFEGTLVIGHHLFADGVDREAATRDWQDWFAQAFA